MADPFSIATGVLAVLSLARAAAERALRFYKGAQSLNNDLASLVAELKSLEGSLNNVHATLGDPENAKRVRELEQQTGCALSSQMLQTMRNCQISAGQLHACFAQVFPKKPGSDTPWFERGLRANKLDHMQEEIARIRQQVQGYLAVMQIDLTLVHLAQQKIDTKANQANAAANQHNAEANEVNADANQANARGIRKILDMLKTYAGDLGKIQDKLEGTKRQIGKDAEEDVRMIDSFEGLRRSSIIVGDFCQRKLSLSIGQLAAVSTAASAFGSIRRKPLGSNALSSSVPEGNERAESTVEPIQRDANKRHMSFNDAVPETASLDMPERPIPFRNSRSFPLQTVTDEQSSAQPAMTAERFEEEMTTVVTSAEQRRKSPDDPFKDTDVDRISSLLSAVGKGAWSERPRTYIVLRLIGHIRAMDGFILEGCKDVHLPYATENELPETLRDPKARRAFIAKQVLVLTPKSEALIRGGKHAHFQNADKRFTNISRLGKGGQGTVDKVTSKLDLQVYARKQMVKPRELAKDKEAMQRYENEIQVLKRLHHKHLVSFVGSYTDRRYVGIIMEPVADMDLRDFLQTTPLLEDDLEALSTYFGCLCSAVSYLHTHQCRHKDIKPANILVKDRQVYVTDFGLALDWSDLHGDTTSGAPTMYTHAYAAPEVAHGAQRNMKADVWSLGCVFLDMLTVLNGRTLEDKRLFMGTRGSVMDVHLNKAGLFGWLSELDMTTTQHEAPHRWIESMLKINAHERPTAEALMNEILRSDNHHEYFGQCCSDGLRRDDSDSFKGSDTEDEGVLTGNSYTRSTTVSGTTLGYAISRTNDPELTQRTVDSIDSQGGAQNLKVADDVDSSARADRLGSAGFADNQAGLRRRGANEWAFSFSSDGVDVPGEAAKLDAAPPDFLVGILELDSADAEALLYQQRDLDKAAWERRLREPDAGQVVDESGNSLLHAAAKFKDESLAREAAAALLLGSADVRALNLAHNSPLHLAAALGRLKLVRDFIAADADAAGLNLRKHTPIHVAAAVGRSAVVRRLLHRAAPDTVHCRDDRDRTPLHWACSAGCSETVAALLDKGADPEAVDEHGDTAFSLWTAKIEQSNIQPDHSFNSPAFEDFLEDAALPGNKSNTLPLELTDDFRSCACEVCKIEKALESVRETGAVVIERRGLCEELAIDLDALVKHLAQCECHECKTIRVPTVKASPQRDADSDSLSITAVAPDVCPEPDVLRKIDSAMPKESKTGEDENAATNSDRPGCTCPDCSSKREAQDDARKSAPPAGCTCADCSSKQEKLEKETKPEACDEIHETDTGCTCPACKYEGHDLWDEWIDRRLPCNCEDCKSKEKGTAADILVAAGFIGKKSYISNPDKAWQWAMDRASTLKGVDAIVKLLASYGANVEAEDFKGRRFLHIAASTGNLALAKTLIDHNAYINASRGTDRYTTKKHFSALDYAVYHVKPAMARLLLREGFDLQNDVIINQLVEGEDFPPECLKMLPMLLSHRAPLEKIYPSTKTPLQIAVAKDYRLVARLLLRAGADINVSSQEEPRPLMSAIMARNPELVELLLEFKADVHEHERGGEKKMCALLLAAHRGSGQIVNILLESSDAAADVERFNRETGWTALHCMARAEALEIGIGVNSLLEYGADERARTLQGEQALHLAAKYGSALMTTLLLPEDPEELMVTLTNDGQTPLDLAIAGRHKEVAELLGGKVPEALLQSNYPPPKKKRWYRRS